MKPLKYNICKDLRKLFVFLYCHSRDGDPMKPMSEEAAENITASKYKSNCLSESRSNDESLVPHVSTKVQRAFHDTQLEACIKSCLTRWGLTSSFLVVKMSYNLNSTPFEFILINLTKYL